MEASGTLACRKVTMVDREWGCGADPVVQWLYGLKALLWCGRWAFREWLWDMDLVEKI